MRRRVLVVPLEVLTEHLCRGCGKAYGAYRHQWSAAYCSRCVEEIDALDAMLREPKAPPRWPWFISWGSIALACLIALAMLEMR